MHKIIQWVFYVFLFSIFFGKLVEDVVDKNYHSLYTTLGACAALIGFFFLLAFLPTILGWFIDPRNSRIIRTHCESLGFSSEKIECWPNHYGVTLLKGSKKSYVKCKVVKGKIKWIGKKPENSN